MTQLSADAKLTTREGRLLGLPVKAATKIYQGSMVALDPALGYALPAADAAGLKFMGLARGQADNSGGLAGETWVEVYTQDEFEAAANWSVAQTDLGRYVYVVDDATVGLHGSHGVLVGKITQVVSASKVMVRPICEGDLETLIGVPVAASQMISAEEYVCLNSAGYAVPGADTAGYVFAGPAAFDADNSAGAAGATKVWCGQGRFRAYVSGVSQGNLGAAAYVKSAGTLVLSAGMSNTVKAGRITEVQAGSWCVVDPATFGK